MLINVIVYILHYLPEILLVGPVLYWLFRELRTEKQWSVAMGVVGGVGMVAAAVLLLSGYAQAPHHNWSNCRLAPAVSWVKGYSLYSYPEDGPMLVQMYGPVSAMVYLPAAMASQPTVAVMIGCVMNTLLFILPAGWFLWCARRGQKRRFALAALAGFLLFSGRQFVLKEAATLVTIDAPAAGFATCAMCILAASRSRDMRAGVLCGIFAALSIWTKLTLAPIVPAMVLYVLLADGWRSAMRFTSGMAISGVGITGVLLLCFGLPLLFQNVVVPSKQPWQWPRLGAWGAYAKAMEWMWRNAKPLGWLSIAAIAMSIRNPPLRLRTVRPWVRENVWVLPLFVGLAVIPTSALAYVKYGGSWNNAAAPMYLIFLAAVAGLLGACRTQPSPLLSASGRVGRVSLVLLVVLGCWMGPATLKVVGEGLQSWSDLSDNENEIAFRYTRQHPGEVFFPSLPLAALMAEGKLYHFDAGIDSLYLAAYPLTDEQIRRHLPPHLRAVVYRSDSMIPALMSRLPEFDRPSNEPTMPNWNIMTRDGAAP